MPGRSGSSDRTASASRRRSRCSPAFSIPPRAGPGGSGSPRGGSVITFVAVGDLRVESIPLFLTLATTTCVIVVAYGVLVGSLAFWSGNAEAVGSQAQNALIHFATYPGSIFRGWVKLLTFTLVPVAMVGHVPAELLRQFGPPIFAGVVGFGVVATALAVGVFSLGLRRYESGNRGVLRA